MSGQIDEAVYHFQQALEVAPDVPKTMHNLGKALLGVAHAQQNVSKIDSAADCFRKVLEQDPDHVPSHYYLGLSLEARGKRAAAMRHFRSAVRLQPDFEPARKKLAE